MVTWERLYFLLYIDISVGLARSAKFSYAMPASCKPNLAWHVTHCRPFFRWLLSSSLQVWHLVHHWQAAWQQPHNQWSHTATALSGKNIFAVLTATEPNGHFNDYIHYKGNDLGFIYSGHFTLLEALYSPLFWGIVCTNKLRIVQTSRLK